MAAIQHPLGRVRRIPWGWAPGPRLGLPRLDWWPLAALLVVGVGAMLPVLQNSTTTTHGFEIQAQEAERARLQGEIRVLESDVATLASLQRVQRRAAEIGLFPARDPMFVTVNEAGPSPAKIPAQYLPGPEAHSGGTEPWWRSLARWLPLLPD